MSPDTAPAFIVTAARDHGPVAPGSFRVVVLEGDREPTIRDFADLERAQRYAEDAASETDGPTGTRYAYVFDDKLVFLGRGRHYAARREESRKGGFAWQRTFTGAAIGATVAIAAYLLDASPWWWVAIPVGLWLGASLRFQVRVKASRL